MILAPHLASTMKTPYAVIVGNHLYSRECRYQIIVPLMRGDGVVDGPGLLRIHERDWFGAFAEPTRAAILVVPAIQSVWYRDDVEHETPFIIDNASMDALEDRLCAMFGIESPLMN